VRGTGALDPLELALRQFAGFDGRVGVLGDVGAGGDVGVDAAVRIEGRELVGEAGVESKRW
jgi:hypothetical protein